MTVQYGVMVPGGQVVRVTPGIGVEQAAEALAEGWNGTVVTRTCVHSLWVDEPSACPRCGLPVWPSSFGAMHADGQTDCLIREGVPT